VLPVIALVGRPNVGKSTLFNRLTKSRDAIVADFPGLTRDRKYGSAVPYGFPCMLIDTGGITGEEIGIDSAMARQSMLAIDESDHVVFMVDARAGITAVDEALATQLREQGVSVSVAVNKVDGLDADVVSSEFYQLGLGEIYPVSASHGRGLKSLFTDILGQYEQQEKPQPRSKESVRIGIVGRPNVGKSTLVNRLLGEERVVVYDEPGTTRDSIYIDYERHVKPYTLIDTAGVRKRKNIKLAVEKFSIVKTLQAIDDANVVVLVVDAREGLVEQDLHLLGQIIDSGRALVIAVNKWDGLEVDDKERIRSELDRRLVFVDYATVHFISALHGSGVGKLYESIDQAYASAWCDFKTPQLTRILEDAVSDHPPPMVQGRRIKLRYAHAGGNNPPRIVIHGNQVDKVPAHYKRYLEKTFRRCLKLAGTPVRIEFKGHDNPYAGRKNKLTPRQVKRKKRLMSHVKKSSRKKK
jgi:GTP-binding protein